MLVDIGLNLSSSRFRNDRAEVVQRAVAAGVERLLLTGTSLEESRLVAGYASEFAPWCHATAGVHPHEASSLNAAGLAELEQLLALPRVVAVGETGLDFNRNYSPPEAQERAFEAQLELAERTGLPLFLHERDAAERMLAMLRATRGSWRGGVIHCFTGSREALHAYLDLGLHIGITGWVCDERRGLELQELVKEIPADRLLLESDAPYLLPRNLPKAPKDKRNAPEYLPHIAGFVAALCGTSADALAARTTANAKALFRLD
jgi:TatD DNase family protein